MAARIWKLTVLDNQRQPAELTVLAAHGHVHLIAPSGEPCIVPPQTDEQIIETLRAAREVAGEQEL